MTNLLFITADHHRFDTLGMVQCKREVTPNLNKLKEESINFKRSYTTCPLCVPARTSLATGMFPTNHGVVVNTFPLLPKDSKKSKGNKVNEGATLPALHDILFKNNYNISHFGMQHISLSPLLEERVQFKKYLNDDHYIQSIENEKFQLFSKKQKTVVHENNGKNFVQESYSNTEVIEFDSDINNFRDNFQVNALIDFLEKDKFEYPSAVFLNIWAPHPPLTVPKEYLEKFPLNEITLPQNINEISHLEPENRRMGIAAQLAKDKDLNHWKKVWQAHLALTNLADELIGRVLNKLKSIGKYDETLIVFTSDHGDHLGQHSMYQKMEMYEQAVRVPLLIKTNDKLNRNKNINFPVSHIDIVPTVLPLLNITTNLTFDGENLLEILDTVLDREVFSQYSGNQNGIGDIRRMIVNSRFKYTIDQTYSDELYDLENDPLEMYNIASKNKDVCFHLKKSLENWFTSKNDFFKY